MTKFKIWDDDNKVFDLIDLSNLEEAAQDLDSFRDYFSASYLKTNPEYLCSYTGLNLGEKELYNGDILEVTHGGNTTRHPIFFEEGCFCVHGEFDDMEGNVATLGYALSEWLEYHEAEVRVVGNVHEQKA